MATITKPLKSRLFLIHKKKILLLKQTSKNGGKFTVPGGTVESFEFAKASLVRETMEEIGVTINPEKLELVHTLHKKKGDSSRIVLYFRIKEWSGEFQVGEPEKFKKVKWFSLDNLPSNISPTVKFVLKQFLDGRRFSEMRKTSSNIY